MSIPIICGNEPIGRSLINCVLLEEEDGRKSIGCDEYYVEYHLRKIKLLFTAMDNLGIKRIHPRAFNSVLGTSSYDDEIIERLANSDDAQLDDFKFLLFEKMKMNPEHLEMGEPEMEIVCDKSCRGTETVIKKNSYGCLTVFKTERPNKCLYRNWL